MADHFVTKTSILPGEFRKVGELLVIDCHAVLARALTDTSDSELAALFATPMVGRNRDGAAINVSWYSDFSGTARPLASLDGALRADVAERLNEKLSLLRDLADAPETPPATVDLINAALCVRSADDIQVIGGQPVLINWGTAPAAVLTDPAALSTHIDETLGSLARPPVPGALRVAGAAAAALSAMPAAATAAAAAPAGIEMAGESSGSVAPVGSPGGPLGGPPGGSVPPRGTADADAPRRFLWWPPVVLIAVLTLVLLWLLLPGTRLFPPPVTALQREISDGALDVSRQINRDLEDRARALEAALEGAVCTPEGDLLLPDGRTPDGLLPPATSAPDTPQTQDDANLQDGNQPPDNQDGIPNPLVPPDPARVQPLQPPGQDGSVANLLDLVEPRTVLVIVPTADGTGTGTGFFIAPDIVATNHHVIEEALGGGEIFVINEALGAVRPATVLSSMGPFEQTGGDYALLRIEGASQPYYSLVDGAVEVKGQAVMAAGYPGDIVYDDLRFQRLLDGSGTETPDLVVTDGIVNSQQQLTSSITMLIHSASISKGNSGGPLVDLCGRVVGMNTFISEASFRNLNLAQSMLNLQQFLETTGVAPTYTTEECSPVIRSEPPVPAPEAADPATGPNDAEAPN